MTNKNKWHTSINDAEQFPLEKGRISSLIFEDKNIQLRYYSPNKNDNQTPHQQDEVYIIAKGKGTFVRGNIKVLFQVGDVIFVPKYMKHYFKDFTDDFATWVIFYGS